MKVFKLPDLGEGLPDAEIHEWFIKEGDTVAADQPMVAMETAKAVVEVPAPRAGKIEKLFGKVGDVIITGAALVEFDTDDGHEQKTAHDHSATVVGAVEVGNEVITESATGIAPQKSQTGSVQVIPAVRKLAETLKVDLNSIKGTGPNGRITASDVKNAHSNPPTTASNTPIATPIAGSERLQGVRRVMAQIMAQSHRDIVPVTISDDADIHAWNDQTDITLRIIRAVVAGVEQQPELNAWFDTANTARKIHDTINLGIAMDSSEGLFVPVIKDVATQTSQAIRETINRYKRQVTDRSIPQQDLHGATIILSNFGSIAGRYANPIIPPPCVAIIGCGKIRDEVVAVKSKTEIHRILPLSITVDHRAITGGEVTRFLKAMLNDLAKAE